jgi:phosphatidylglycerophosphatase A
MQMTTRNPSHSPLDYLALAISTWGVGYLPIAPGTWGSAVGVLLFWVIGLWAKAGNIDSNLSFRGWFLGAEVLVVSIITVAGIWGASRVERLMRRKDPGKVVVDEVAGQMISLLPLAWLVESYAKGWVIISFILFRFFDIVKPYPARKFEGLHGGLGVMADDLVAGVYGALVTIVLIRIFNM